MKASWDVHVTSLELSYELLFGLGLGLLVFCFQGHGTFMKLTRDLHGTPLSLDFLRDYYDVPLRSLVRPP